MNPARGSAVAFGLASEVIGAILVGVLDARPKEGAEVIIREAVEDRSTLAAGVQKGAVAEQTQLVADGRNRETGVVGELGDAEAIIVGQRVDDPDPGRVSDRGKEPAQALHDPLGKLRVWGCCTVDSGLVAFRVGILRFVHALIFSRIATAVKSYSKTRRIWKS